MSGLYANLLRTCQTVFQSSHTILFPHQHSIWGLLPFLHTLSTLATVCLFLSGYKTEFLSEFVCISLPCIVLFIPDHNFETRANVQSSQAICELEKWQMQGQSHQQTMYPPENILPHSTTTGPLLILEHCVGQPLQMLPAVTVSDHKFILLKTLFTESIFSLASTSKTAGLLPSRRLGLQPEEGCSFISIMQAQGQTWDPPWTTVNDSLLWSIHVQHLWTAESSNYIFHVCPLCKQPSFLAF